MRKTFISKYGHPDNFIPLQKPLRKLLLLLVFLHTFLIISYSDENIHNANDEKSVKNNPPNGLA